MLDDAPPYNKNGSESIDHFSGDQVNSNAGNSNLLDFDMGFGGQEDPFGMADQKPFEMPVSQPEDNFELKR